MKLLVVAGLSISSFSQAASLSGLPVTVNVSNAFNFSEGASQLSFGTIRAVADTGSNVASITVAPDGTISTSGTSPASISRIADGTPATFTIDSAAPGTRLYIGAVTATNIAIVPTNLSNPTFTVGSFTFLVTTDGASNAYNGTNLVTNSSGEATFSMGATLTTQANASTASYADGPYSGTYDISVDY